MNALHDFSLTLVSVFRGVLAASWQGSLAIVLVLLVRLVLGFRAPARWRYLLWSVVLIRLLVPAFALPRNPASIENIPVVAHPFEHLRTGVTGDRAAEAKPGGVVVSSEASEPLDLVQGDSRPMAGSHPIGKRWSRWEWGAVIWMGGALVFGGWFVVCAARLGRRLREETSPADEAIQVIWRDGCRRWLQGMVPPILTAEWVDSPALVGVWRPTLLIPREAVSSFSAEDWEHVFAHEIAHLRRRDHWSQLLLLLALGAHWFNPLVWVGFRRLRADRELAADEWALQRLEGGRALAYGETLFKTLAARSGSFFHPGMVGISEDGAQMKERLRRITAFLPRRFYGSVAGFAAVVALGTVLLGQSASHTVDSPVKPAPKPEDEPLKLTLQPAAIMARNVPEEIVAAARAGDSNQVGYLLRLPEPGIRGVNASGAMEMLDELLRRRELTAFTLLLDEIRKVPVGKYWDVSDELLATLVKDGRKDFLEALLARRFNLNRLSAQVKIAEPAVAEWITRRVAEVSKQRADIEALGKAASEGDLPAMRVLVEAGADVNGVGKDDNTPLLRAVQKDRLEAAQFLLDHGAEVDKPRLPGWDYTPLCLVHSVAMAEVLKKAGANVHARLFRRDVSILTYVAARSTADVVAWFLQQGLDPKMIGDNGRTLLFELKDGRVAELLLDAGVDPNLADQFGRTAISTARSGEVAQKLIDHGAKVRGLANPLLPNMIFNGAGAMEAVIKAGADRDPATLETALSYVDRLNKKDFPDKDKIKELLIGLGGKPNSASGGAPQITCRAIVSTVDGGRIDFLSGKLYGHGSLSVGGVNYTEGDSSGIDADGAAQIQMRADAETVNVAAAMQGYATTFAGPFTAPLKEKMDGIRMTLTKGFSATIQLVDETGRPIAGARFTGYYPGPPLLDFGFYNSDSSGQAVLRHIGAARLNVNVIAGGYEADEVTDIHLDAAKPYVWTLKKARALPGVVRSAATGQPIAGAVIKLAGVRGPHVENYSDPETAPLLTTTDEQGRFALTTLRPDSRYFLFVEAPGYGGVLRGEVKAGDGEMKVVLGPELTVRGKVIHVPAGLMHGGEMTAGYNQYFPIGDEKFATGRQARMKPKDGEAEFVIGPLYAYPVEIRIGEKTVKLEAKELPRAGVVVDLAR